jgi:putative transposase
MPVSIGEDDSLGYRHGLGEALKESGCALHAYVLMTNPVHLLLTPPQPQDVPRLINLARAALRAVHQQNLSPHRHAVGQPLHVVTGARRHLLALCQRYSELNPVRAAMVTTRRTTVGAATLIQENEQTP